ncbi:glycoside hydrolase N-terminal domain-containing protein [Isoptericola halotolerans]|uniref:glycosyl hydrolase family 95 catalytic domain-containing protein n=1 Tax=Isoptericola halotolerans TaxID=300560 RepID=UPI00388FEA37
MAHQEKSGAGGLRRRHDSPRRSLAFGLAAIMAVPVSGLAIAPAAAADQVPTAVEEADRDRIDGPPDTVWFDEPLPTSGDEHRNWQQRALPIGNGAMGAVVYGGVTDEQIQLNEKSLWTGGPGAEGGYNYGNWTDDRGPETIDHVRDLIADSPTGGISPGEASSILGHNKVNFGSYQTFGDLHLTMDGIGEATDYRRQLDIGDSLVTTSFTADGTDYTREYFASGADDVIVVRLTADGPGKIGFDAAIELTEDRSDVVQTAENGRLTTSGSLTNNGLRFESQIQVLNEGGTVTDGDGSVSVADADAVTLVFSAATDYSTEYSDDYRNGVDPHEPVTAAVDAAAARSYDDLLERHQADYRELFDRATLDLAGSELPDIPTDALLDEYRGEIDTESALALESLYFQYGRYLLISSSRPGSLPANLQGVWNRIDDPPWDADYHVNINMQMNYWPAETTNLSELANPMFDYVDSLVEPGTVTATEMYGTDGWVVGNETNPYGFTGLHRFPTSFWHPDAAAWLAQHYWQHYLFTQDEEFLAERAYPMLKSVTEFWIDFLVEDTDGTYVVSPSFSPEQGEFTAGASMAQQVVTEVLSSAVVAADLVGETDTTYLTDLEEKLDGVYPGLGIGSWGQLKEWKIEQELDNPDNQHRHVSHLYALFPGSAVSPAETPEFAEAAEVSLNARGDGGTGWSKAWKINFWARLLDGDRAHQLLEEKLVHSTLDNLWGDHPPFQIDGNFGVTSGVAEMLLQSQAGRIDVLPALPSSWPEGSYQGLKARGDVEVDASWENGSAREIRLTPANDGELRVANAMVRSGMFTLEDADGNAVEHTVEDDVVVFDGIAETTYVLSANAALSISTADSAQTGDEIPVTVRVDALGDEAVPGSSVVVTVPDETASGLPDWAVEPETLDFDPVEAGESAEQTVMVTVGPGDDDGRSDISATLTVGEASIDASTSIEVKPPPPCTVPAEDDVLVAWNLGEDGDGDQSGYGRDWRVEGSEPVVSEGPTGSAQELGTDGYVTSVDEFPLGYLQQSTWAGEFKIDSGQGGWRRLIDHRSATSDSDGVMIDTTRSNNIRIITAGVVTTTDAVVPTDEWFELVVTFSTDGVVTVYVDGEQVATETIAGYEAANACTSRTLHIGANREGKEQQRGGVDRLAIFGKALSAEEVANWQALAFEDAEAPVDTVRPVAELVSPSSSGPLAGLSVRVDATDESGLERIVANIYRDGELVKSTQSAVADGATSGSHTAEVSLPDGDYVLKFNAHDLAGNVSRTGRVEFTIDATAPRVTVKDGERFTVGGPDSFEKVSFKLFDAGLVDRVEVNGVVKDLSDNRWSDVNFLVPGTFGAVQGANVLEVFDVAGNSATVEFTLS